MPRRDTTARMSTRNSVISTRFYRSRFSCVPHPHSVELLDSPGRAETDRQRDCNICHEYRGLGPVNVLEKEEAQEWPNSGHGISSPPVKGVVFSPGVENSSGYADFFLGSLKLCRSHTSTRTAPVESPPLPSKSTSGETYPDQSGEPELQMPCLLAEHGCPHVARTFHRDHRPRTQSGPPAPCLGQPSPS